VGFMLARNMACRGISAGGDWGGVLDTYEPVEDDRDDVGEAGASECKWEVDVGVVFGA
jgi:hypothetical protein